jgi:GNAT superfamily N-acetyltransferase
MAVDLKIIEEGNLRDLKKFVKFPIKLYRDHPYYVPDLISSEMDTLDWKKNPSFEICDARYWLAHRNGKIVGRIVGIINRNYIKKWGNKYGRFGWIDFIDDREVSTALMDAVEGWCREKGMKGLHGPLGFTDFDKEGMLVQGFDELGTQPMIYNYPYYPKHLEALGYKKDADWVEFEVSKPDEIPEKIARIQELVLRRNSLKVFTASSTKDLLRFGKQAIAIVNEAYSDLYAFVELTDKQIDLYLKKYFDVIVPRYAKGVIDEEDNLVAFGFAMPSLSKALQKARGRLFPFGVFHIMKALNFPKTLDMYLIAVKKDYQRRGVAAVVLGEITKEAFQHGITSAETSGELEDNADVQALWKHFPTRQHKRRRVYLKIFDR